MKSEMEKKKRGIIHYYGEFIKTKKPKRFCLETNGRKNQKTKKNKKTKKNTKKMNNQTESQHVNVTFFERTQTKETFQSTRITTSLLQV